MSKEEKPLNIYHVSELWSDGKDEFVVLTCFVRAESEQHAVNLMMEQREGVPESSNIKVEMLGWATGENMCKAGLITLEFTPEDLRNED